jgi:hypothetical protein
LHVFLITKPEEEEQRNLQLPNEVEKD